MNRAHGELRNGWAHFSEGRAEIELAFEEAGLSGVLRSVDHGSRVRLRASSNG